MATLGSTARGPLRSARNRRDRVVRAIENETTWSGAPPSDSGEPQIPTGSDSVSNAPGDVERDVSTVLGHTDLACSRRYGVVS